MDDVRAVMDAAGSERAALLDGAHGQARASPVKRVAHPRASQSVLGYDDQLAILFQEPDRHPTALA
jgi:hypothetical protein